MLCFRDLGASFSSLGCFVFEFWVLRFRDLGASCFGLRFRVLRFRYYHYVIAYVIYISKKVTRMGLNWALPRRKKVSPQELFHPQKYTMYKAAMQTGVGSRHIHFLEHRLLSDRDRISS